MALDLLSSIAKKNEGVKESLPKETTAPEAQKEPEVPKTPDAKIDDKPVVEKPKEVTAESDLQRFLKENGIASLDELKEKITPTRKKSPDEEEAEFIEWGVKNADLKMDDIISAKELQKKKDADVVFDELAKLPKNKNKTPEQIQAAFDKKFGETLEREVDGEFKTQILYDEDEIKEAADRIRNQKYQPIAVAQNKYKTASQMQQAEMQLSKEFEKLSKSIPDKIDIRIDDKNSLPYEITEEYKKILLPKFESHYKQFRKIFPDKEFVLNDFLEFTVKADNFGNIANIHRQNGIDAERLEAAKKLENPIVEPKSPTGATKPSVDMKASKAQVGNILKGMK